ncbi:putative alpha/beta-fold hydrolase [Natronocella acetinitrilica]|uniref:Alpha/beta-fold hydrolase n=1 Tax=Natronocella acetinitrilica TaxID=414046 RepID=A0AAE3KG29_9GAMM|nr:hydrolase [Natronocella acetinitrilica]MCP1674752.1 putative alpha/beta-fold hydrolase [Natronocella acetinitrilica]
MIDINSREVSPFEAPGWLCNAHGQTMWQVLFRRPPAVAITVRPLTLRDGDELRLAWGPERAGPVVVILHGLGGCARSPYVLGLIQALADRGMQGVVMQFRGAGDVPNRLPRFFHAGEWLDLEETIKHIHQLHPARPLAVTGFSMGGIVTLNWLAAMGEKAGAQAAVVVSTPLDLAACAEHLNKGFARVYQWEIVRNLKGMVRRKHQSLSMPAAVATLDSVRTLWQFDDRLTAPIHGFNGATDYYARCSPIQRLRDIRRPTWIIHAADDPFIPVTTLPRCWPSMVRLQLSPRGGHVGFVQGTPMRPSYWLDNAIADCVETALRWV